MNKTILNPVIQEFINNNLNDNISSLMLKKQLFENVSQKELVEQIEAKNKCKNKLPTWYKTDNIYYPNKLNIEQTSSELTAEYKSHLVSGKSLIDITGGLGIDCYFFSKNINYITHCEINDTLSAIAKHNFNVLGVTNIEPIVSDGIDLLKTKKEKFDWIYADPSRRHDSKGKVFYLSDCLPNIPEHLDTLFKYSSNILLKVSPMLDISIAISELKFVKDIHVVTVNNEVKELLFILEHSYTGDIKVHTANLKANAKEQFSFNLKDEFNAVSKQGSIKKYLYEPNTAILKAGAFKLISQNLELDKLHKHSHLYTSDSLIDFPGRSFLIEETILYNKKEVLKRLKNKKANVSTRNFPETVKQLKTKFKFKDGGKEYVFFTTNYEENKVVLFCKKI